MTEEQPPGAGWRDTPWHKRTKEQRRARYEAAEADRKAKYAQRMAGVSEAEQRRLAELAKDLRRPAHQVRSERASHEAFEREKRGAPPVSARPARTSRVAYRLATLSYWQSNVQLFLVLAPLALVGLGVLAFVVYLAVT